MIKKLLIAVAIIGTATYSQAQGYVNFATRTLGSTARVYDVGGTTALNGSAFFAQLYAADGTLSSDATLTAKGTPVNFGTTSSSAGYVQSAGTSTWNGGWTIDSSVAVTASTADSTVVTIQLRAWSADTTTTTFATASKSGKSTLIQATAVSSSSGSTPPDLTGLTGFSLTPEPTTMALGALGLSALLFRRRK